MKSDKNISTRRAALCGLLLAWLAEGCGSLSVAVPWKKMPLDASAGFYESASIVYRLDAGKLEQPLDVARVEGQKILYEQVASSPLAEQSMGTLTITYPHPGGRPGMAQAMFAIDSAPGQAAKGGSFAQLEPAVETTTASGGPLGTGHVSARDPRDLGARYPGRGV